MKAIKTLGVGAFFCLAVLACNSNPSDPGSTLGDLTDMDQAELVATALSSDKGGIGQDIENIANPTLKAAAAAQISLTVSVTMDYYDADDHLQQAYDPDTTDRIDYEGVISGELHDETGYFQDLIIDNRTSFMATELLSGTAVIDGTHSNHSSYTRIARNTGNRVYYSLECDLSAVGVAVDTTADDTFPEAGTIEGTVAGTYERTTDFTQESRELYFQFTAEYLGDNTARITLNNGSVFIVQLETGDVEEQPQE